MQGIYYWLWGGGGCSWCFWWWCHDSHQCGYLLHHIVCCTTPFGLNLLIFRLDSPGLYLLVECCSLVRRNCLILLLVILHIFNSSSTVALTFLLYSYFLVRWLYPWNIHISRIYLLALIDECFVQGDTSIVISPEGSSFHDLILECVKLMYLDTQIQMSDLGPGINTHIPMLLDNFKDVVLILLNFHVAFKVEPLTFTRLMCGDEDPFILNHYVIYIICSQ